MWLTTFACVGRASENESLESPRPLLARCIPGPWRPEPIAVKNSSPHPAASSRPPLRISSSPPHPSSCFPLLCPPSSSSGGTMAPSLLSRMCRAPRPFQSHCPIGTQGPRIVAATMGEGSGQAGGGKGGKAMELWLQRGKLPDPSWPEGREGEGEREVGKREEVGTGRRDEGDWGGAG